MHASSRLGGLLLIGVLAVAAIGCADQPLVAPSSRGAASPSPAQTSAAPSFVRPTPAPSPTFLIHEVRAGETLTSIARLYGTTARSIAYWNRGTYPSLDPDSSDYEPDRIVVGWLLRVIPTAVVDEDDLPVPTHSPSSSASGSPAPAPSAAAQGESRPPGPA